MKRLTVMVMLAFAVSACSVSLSQLIQDARWGVDAVCMIGQNTLPADVCSDTLTTLDTAKALADKDGNAARAGVKQLLTQLEMQHPQIIDWTHWLTASL
jgi:hypothetical protein